MKKSDLKSGMLVKTRAGNIGLIVKDNCHGEDAVIFNAGDWTGLDGYSENLIWHEFDVDRIDYCKTIDIVAVYKPDLPTGFLSRKSKFGSLELLWERKPEKTFELDGVKYSESTLRSIIKKATS